MDSSNSGKTTEKKEKRGFLLASEAIWLAVIPFIGTFVVFVYEYSYLSFYGIPAGFIQLDVVKIISASAAIIFLVLVLLFMTFYVRFLAGGEHPLQRALVTPLTMCLMLGPFLYLGRAEFKWQILAGVFVVSYLFCLVGPFFDRGNDDAGYLERLRKSNSEPINVEYKDKAFGVFAEYISFPVFFTFLVAMLGDYNAAEKIAYMKVAGENRVLIEVYGDLMIFKDFDPKTKKLSAVATFLKIGEGDAISLERANVGPLEKYEQSKSS